MISEPKIEENTQEEEMYVLIGLDRKITLDDTQQKKLNELLDSWDYSAYCPENKLLYGGQMFRVVVANSTGETVWVFGENGITVNSIDRDGVWEPIAKYGTDEALFSKVKNIVYGEDSQ